MTISNKKISSDRISPIGNTPKPSFPLKPMIFGSLAAAFEWYDYALFGYFIAIIGSQFFPSTDPINSLLSTYATFASGFLMRPLGAILFGYVGDRVGRKYALGASLLLMAVPTTALGLLPTYDTIGIWAPIGLVLIRLLQGLSVGGNYGGSFIFTIENAPERKKSFAGSLPSLGTLGGLFLGSGVASLLTAIMTKADLLAYGWRIPFLLGSLSALMGLAIRFFIKDEPKVTPQYAAQQIPIIEILKNHLKNLFCSIGIILLDGVGIYVVFVFMTTFATVFLGMPDDKVHFTNTVTMALLVASIPFFGLLGDRIRPTTLLKGVSLGFMTSIPLFGWLCSSHSLEALWATQLVFALLMGAVYGLLPVTITQLFPKSVRYTASGLAFNISIAVFGGSAPLVITSLIKKTGILMIPAFMLTIVGAVSLLCLVLYKKKETSY